MKRLMTRLHAAVYRRFGGRFLGSMGGHPVLLLETVGRHSGVKRQTPVQFMADGQGFVVVAANGGAARPPAWYLNLCANPAGRVQVGDREMVVTAHEEHGQSREALWEELTAASRYLERTQRKAGRELPVMVLKPEGRHGISAS
jgi:F420H(2)-dependent quinone reductase